MVSSLISQSLVSTLVRLPEKMVLGRVSVSNFLPLVRTPLSGRRNATRLKKRLWIVGEVVLGAVRLLGTAGHNVSCTSILRSDVSMVSVLIITGVSGCDCGDAFSVSSVSMLESASSFHIPSSIASLSINDPARQQRKDGTNWFVVFIAVVVVADRILEIGTE